MKQTENKASVWLGRIFAFIALLAWAVFIWLADHRSMSPEIFGRYSPEYLAFLAIVLAGIACLVMFYLGWRIADSRYAPLAAAHAAVAHETAASGGDHHAFSPAVYSIVPFAALLLCIAILPLFHATEHWWERNWNRLLVAGLVSIPFYYGNYAKLAGHLLVDYSHFL